MDYRILGRTGLKVSILSFGGIMLDQVSQEKANKTVAKAIESGVNLFDVGPTYGTSQKKLGKALESYRKDVILTCKTEPEQTASEVRADIENSLDLLKTNYFDIYQLHEVTDEKSLNSSLKKNGALEAIIKAKEEGIIKYIGFSAHSEWAALKLMEEFDFDTIMVPINWNYWYQNQWEKVIKEARKTKKGILAIKALAQRQWNPNEQKEGYNTWYKPIFDNVELAELALRFTLSKDIDTAISPGDTRMLDLGLKIIKEYSNRSFELSDTEVDRLKKYIKTHGGKLYPIPK
ncbi:MAG: aldo/keto reductase [bacterium]